MMNVSDDDDDDEDDGDEDDGDEDGGDGGQCTQKHYLFLQYRMPNIEMCLFRGLLCLVRVKLNVSVLSYRQLNDDKNKILKH